MYLYWDLRLIEMDVAGYDNDCDYRGAVDEYSRCV